MPNFSILRDSFGDPNGWHSLGAVYSIDYLSRFSRGNLFNMKKKENAISKIISHGILCRIVFLLLIFFFTDFYFIQDVLLPTMPQYKDDDDVIIAKQSEKQNMYFF